MKMFKVLLLAFLVLQYSNAVDIQTTLAINDIVLQQEMVPQFMDGIEAIISNVFGHNISEEFGNEIEQILIETRNQIERFNETLAEIRQNASEIGEEVGQCINSEQENILAATTKAQAIIQNCLNDARDNVMTSYSIVNKFITDVVSSVQQWVKDFNNCSNILCKVALVAQVSGMVSNFQASAKEATEQFTETLRSTIGNLRNCAGVSLQDLAADLSVITERIQQCISNIE